MGVRTRGGQFHKKRKQTFAADRRGFSLLEILIAMIILALIAAPLCRAFVLAMRTNANARKNASATSVAENVMEGVNAFTYDGAVEQFDPDQTADGDFLICQNVVGQNAVERRVVQNDDNGPVVFALKNVKEDVYTFDVRVTLDRTPYMRSESPEDGSESPETNDYELISVTKYRAEKDHLFAENENALRVACVNHGCDYDTVRNSLEREIIVTVKKSDSEGHPVDDCVTVSMTFRYMIDGDTWEDTSFGAREYRTADLLRSCYLCYLPNYGAPGSDTIIINNEDHVEFDLYLIKQKSKVEPNLEGKENSYTPTVRIYEGSKESADQEAFISVHTNYHTNLATGKGIAGAGGAEYHYYYKLGASDSYQEIPSAAIKNMLHMTNSVIGTTPAERMFRVQVEVFEEGAYDADFTGDDIQRVAELSNE